MTRHVNSKLTNEYWMLNYDNIRNLYPENIIVIIDDNSNYDYIDKEKILYNTYIIQSEYIGRGELLPYYYFLKHKFFDIAIILNDSAIINKYIDILSVDTYKILWGFNNIFEYDEYYALNVIKQYNDDNLTKLFLDKNNWTGCFGSMCIITHDYLTSIDNKYPFVKLLDYILVRDHRCCFERILAVLLQIDHVNDTMFGIIHDYCPWGIKYSDIQYFKHLPIIKVWTGR